MTHDLRHALRLLRLNPGFTALAILTLALGIGACVTMFTIINGVLLRPLPYPSPERMVALWELGRRSGETVASRQMAVAWPNVVDWKEQTRTLEALAGYEGGTTTVLGGKEAQRADVYSVSEDFFRVLGVPPRLGRPFSDAEQRPGGTPVALVGDEFWRRTFGGGREVAGQTLTIDGQILTIVGVMPPGFAFPAGASVWVPASLEPQKGDRTAHNFRVIGRIGPGQTIDSVRSEMAAIAARLKAAYGKEENAEGILVRDLRENLVGPSRTPLQLLMGAVLLVLLIACANLANTLLASGTRRRREIAMRSALGASRTRLIRQLLTESLVLALIGGLAGLWLSRALLPTLLALAPDSLPRTHELQIDGRATAFAMVLTLVTVALFGLLPALQTARTDLRDVLADAARGSSAPRTARMRALLITSQVAVAFVLLVGSGLLIRSLEAVLSQPIGFDPTNVLTAEITLPKTTYATDAQVAAYYDRALERIRKLPGVEQAGMSLFIPLTGYDPNGGFAMTGGTDPLGDASYSATDADYFRALRIPLLAGRLYDSRDTYESEHVAVINKTLADRYWPGRSAVGQRVRFLGMDSYADRWLTIIGVVGDTKGRSITNPTYPEIFVSIHQRPGRGRWSYLIVRASGNLGAVDSLINPVRAVLRDIDPDVPPKFATFETVIGENVADRRFVMLILSAFGALALLLTAIGIYGVLAYTVAQRTSEIGIRMALGATRGAVVQLVLGSAYRSIAIGLAAGGIGAWLLAGTIRGFLFNVQAADPLVAVLALLSLLAAATVAAAVPAWRASRVDPQVSMRAE
jgi:predicted permease